MFCVFFFTNKWCDIRWYIFYIEYVLYQTWVVVIKEIQICVTFLSFQINFTHKNQNMVNSIALTFNTSNQTWSITTKIKNYFNWNLRIPVARFTKTCSEYPFYLCIKFGHCWTWHEKDIEKSKKWILNVSLQLISVDLWPLYVTFDLLDIWSFSCCIFVSSLVTVKLCMTWEIEIFKSVY